MSNLQHIVADELYQVLNFPAIELTIFDLVDGARTNVDLETTKLDSKNKVRETRHERMWNAP